MSAAQTAADRRKEQAKKLLANSREDADTPRPGATARRTTPVRLPVSLPPELHRQFRQWALDAAASANVPEIPMAAAVRALVAIVIDDPALTETVIQNVLHER